MRPTSSRPMVQAVMLIVALFGALLSAAGLVDACVRGDALVAVLQTAFCAANAVWAAHWGSLLWEQAGRP